MTTEMMRQKYAEIKDKLEVVDQGLRELIEGIEKMSGESSIQHRYATNCSTQVLIAIEWIYEANTDIQFTLLVNE